MRRVSAPDVPVLPGQPRHPANRQLPMQSTTSLATADSQSFYGPDDTICSILPDSPTLPDIIVKRLTFPQNWDLHHDDWERAIDEHCWDDTDFCESELDDEFEVLSCQVSPLAIGRRRKTPTLASGRSSARMSAKASRLAASMRPSTRQSYVNSMRQSHLGSTRESLRPGTRNSRSQAMRFQRSMSLESIMDKAFRMHRTSESWLSGRQNPFVDYDNVQSVMGNRV